jgi:hypothetical protein
MEEYSVSVRNELTGEATTVQVESFSAKDAQVQALTLVFRREGWRSSRALEPQQITVEARSA